MGKRAAAHRQFDESFDGAVAREIIINHVNIFVRN